MEKTLRRLFAGALLFQAAVLLVCVALERANASAGFLKYRLPPVVFWAYVCIGIAAPAVALITLIVLGAKRKASRSLIAWCVATIAGAVMWYTWLGLVFFAAGGTR